MFSLPATRPHFFSSSPNTSLAPFITLFFFYIFHQRLSITCNSPLILSILTQHLHPAPFITFLFNISPSLSTTCNSPHFSPSSRNTSLSPPTHFLLPFNPLRACASQWNHRFDPFSSPLAFPSPSFSLHPVTHHSRHTLTVSLCWNFTSFRNLSLFLSLSLLQ